MVYARERAGVICAQLKQQAFRRLATVDGWYMKEGLYFTPREAEAAPAPWQHFDAQRDRWEGADRHVWFRAELTVSSEMAGKRLWLRFFTEVEGWDARNAQFLFLCNGQARQGLDVNHTEVELTRDAKAGERYELALQAYSGTMDGEFRLLCTVDEVLTPVYDLYYDLLMPTQALGRMEKETQPRLAIERAMNDTINLLDLREVYSPAYFASIDTAAAHLQQALYTDLQGYNEVIATCIGHTHIDVAWWWTVAQTREKTARSFSTVLKFMEEYPEYTFMSSQPQLYVFIKERHPELYAKIKQRVAEGRWEAEGGMWLEADCNLTSGESLVRQFMHGKRFFRDEFGVDNRVLWLPDVFGYSGALPQICKRCGIDYFMTTKLSWNQFNKVPCDTLRWYGIDGTDVFTHFISTLDVGQSPERFFTTYNGRLHPDALMGAWQRYQQKDINNDILISFGHGDGGGGPTREMLETGRRMARNVRGIPTVRQAPTLQYFQELEARVKDQPTLPNWVGEFYFEYHRGTYTSMARNKRANRKSELMLMDAELLSVLAVARGVAYPAQALDEMWKTVLLNQFHDILPGSSIAEVYAVTKAEYEALALRAGDLIAERLRAIAGQGQAVALVNTLGFDRDDVVCLGDVQATAVSVDGVTYPVQQTEQGAITYVRGLPAKGYTGATVAQAAQAANPLTVTEGGIDTPFYTVAFNAAGELCSLVDKAEGRELVPAGQAFNRLRLYEDKPVDYDNWDIDIYYSQKAFDVDGLTSMTWVERGPVRATLRIERTFSRSRLRQDIRFYADTRRIDFETWVDWQECQHLLKTHFPLDLHTDEATFDIQFGNVTRKTHQNTSWEKARFESCAQKWMDVSEGGYGVSLLNDCKYGHSMLDGVMALTLLKAGIVPNPATDVEEHTFTYSLYPHQGTWREGDTAREAYKLNQPVYAVVGAAADSFSYAKVDRDNVILETVKQAEDGQGVILRVYENQNKRTNATITLGAAVGKVTECDLLEQRETDVPVRDGKVSFQIKPYQIKTFRVE